MKKIKINGTIIVEGKYDKIKLSSIIDGNIITTDGFGIYRNTEKTALIKKLAEKSPVIILTDPDRAGRQIRSHIKNILGGKNIFNVHIPGISGKEKRKSAPSKENLLGVEGIDVSLILDTFSRFGILNGNAVTEREPVTKFDLYADGLTGTQDSSEKRRLFCEKLNIPYLSSNALLETVNILMDKNEYKRLVQHIQIKK